MKRFVDVRRWTSRGSAVGNFPDLAAFRQRAGGSHAQSTPPCIRHKGARSGRRKLRPKKGQSHAPRGGDDGSSAPTTTQGRPSDPGGPQGRNDKDFQRKV